MNHVRQMALLITLLWFVTGCYLRALGQSSPETRTITNIVNQR